MDASRRTTQRTRVRAAAIAGLMLAAGVGSAQAQYVFDDEILPPRAVVWRLSERGFSAMSRPRFDGRAYVVDAFAPNGARVRLFVDAHEGDIVGRQRLDAPLDAPPLRVARPAAPGYGWTEEDSEPSRPVRQAERLVPPADIPFPGGRPVSPGPALRPAPAYPEPAQRRAELPVRPDAGAASHLGANSLGANPDARPRSEPSRKAAKLVPPAKPAAPRLSPEAPAPKVAPSEPAPVAVRSEPKAAEPAAKPEAVKAEPTKPETVKAEPAPTPASVQPPPAEAPEVKAPEAKPPEVKAAEAKTAESGKAADSWKDPPPEKRAVRVIGGATIVPGADGKADATHTQ